MRILLFAGLAEAVGQSQVDLVQGASTQTAGDLEVRIREGYPDLAKSPFRIAVNRVYAEANDPVVDGDEVALIPPVSGG
ncbi:MAG: MoaD/ThiS family protein [Planctomycetota bacterium]|nr:MoaD/ThiS family protein [Planctomycetota bacterium]